MTEAEMYLWKTIESSWSEEPASELFCYNMNSRYFPSDDPENRQLRKTVENLIFKHGKPIGSSSRGWYLIGEEWELPPAVKYLNSKGAFKRARQIILNYVHEHNLSLELFDEKGEKR